MKSNTINILSDSSLSRKTKILFLVDYENEVKTVSKIKELGISNGLREIDNWNISMILKSSKGLVVKVKDGWTITSKGKELLKSELPEIKSPITSQHQDLVQLVSTVKTQYVREFIEEAIQSLEYKLLKSAVVFSWIGAVSILYDYVVKSHLVEFNKEANKRNIKWKDAANTDGLSRMKEYDILQILEAINIIGKNTKTQLEHCLDLRNSCGHPSTLKIGENKVAAHLEILILNVYLKFN